MTVLEQYPIFRDPHFLTKHISQSVYANMALEEQTVALDLIQDVVMELVQRFFDGTQVFPD